MILADASVWIDFLRDIETPQVDRLLALMGGSRLAVGDLTLTEVLQGIGRDEKFAAAVRLFSEIPVVEIAGSEVAVAAAQNYRTLRARGITVRKTIDTLIATRCIVGGYALLFSDRDFAPFVEQLGLRDAMAD